jgi:hypothetical protein
MRAPSYVTVYYRRKQYRVFPDGNVFVVVVRKIKRNPLEVPTYMRQLRSQTPIWRRVKFMASVQPKDKESPQ